MTNSARYKKRVLRGFKLAANLLLGFFTLVLLLGGIAGLTGDNPGRWGILGDCVALAIALVILFRTAHRWGRWLGGFFGVPGVINSLAMLSSGHLLNSPDKPVTRIEALSGLTFSILLIVLTYPLRVPHRPTGTMDRTCLVGIAVGFGFAANSQNPSAIYAWIAVCSTLLFIVWFRYRSKHRRSVRHGDSPVEDRA